MVIDAVYEHGVFRPTSRVELREGTKVTFTVPDAPDTGEEPAWLKYAGSWSDEFADEVERIIEETCEQIHPGDYPEDYQ